MKKINGGRDNADKQMVSDEARQTDDDDDEGAFRCIIQSSKIQQNQAIFSVFTEQLISSANGVSLNC